MDIQTEYPKWKAACKEQGLTLRQVCEDLGINYSYLLQKKIKKLNTIVKINNYLGIKNEL